MKKENWWIYNFTKHPQGPGLWQMKTKFLSRLPDSQGKEVCILKNLSSGSLEMHQNSKSSFCAQRINNMILHMLQT